MFPDLISRRGQGTGKGYFLELVGKEQRLVFRTCSRRVCPTEPDLQIFRVRWGLELGGRKRMAETEKGPQGTV